MKEVLRNITDDDSFEAMEISPQDDYAPNEMPYSDEELIKRAEKGRREIAEGRFYTNEEVFRMMERKYEKIAV
jgi:hypothetical protein